MKRRALIVHCSVQWIRSVYLMPFVDVKVISLCCKTSVWRLRPTSVTFLLYWSISLRFELSCIIRRQKLRFLFVQLHLSIRYVLLRLGYFCFFFVCVAVCMCEYVSMLGGLLTVAWFCRNSVRLSLRLSVRLSVTPRYRSKPRWDSGFSLYDSLARPTFVSLSEEIPL